MDRTEAPPDSGQIEGAITRNAESFGELIQESPDYQEKIEALEKQVADLVRSRQKLEITIPETDDEISFGVIADTHFGSMYERMDCLRDYYSAARRRQISTILHAGDVLDGQDIYRGHRYEIYKHGWQQQRDHFVESAPRYDGIKTHFITGNHDAAFRKQAGIDVGSELMDRRTDWNCIGEMVGRIDLKTENGAVFKIVLLHPDGGTPYAISYRMQKVIESIPGGEKPHLYIEGHLHKMCVLPNHRNVCGVDAGCFQDQTPFMARKGTPAHKGGYFFTVRFMGDSRLSMQTSAEWITYY